MMAISQEQLEENSPECAAKFLQLYDQTVEGVDNTRWTFWCGWDAADRQAGHFSQDEINFVVDLALMDKTNNGDVFKGLVDEMRKGLRG